MQRSKLVAVQVAGYNYKYLKYTVDRSGTLARVAGFYGDIPCVQSSVKCIDLWALALGYLCQPNLNCECYIVKRRRSSTVAPSQRLHNLLLITRIKNDGRQYPNTRFSVGFSG